MKTSSTPGLVTNSKPGAKRWRLLAATVAISFALSPIVAIAQQQVYVKPSDFLRGAFPKGVPGTKTVSLSGATGSEVKAILGHPYRYGTRVNYWRSGERTAWILDEIGKVRPITTGFIIDDGVISSVQVLVYRESHGYEVQRPFFTKQFKGLRLEGGKELSKSIDGISGATMSVRSLMRLSKMALYLHGVVGG